MVENKALDDSYGQIDRLIQRIEALTVAMGQTNQALAVLSERVETQTKRLDKMSDYGADIARLDTYVKLTWAILVIIVTIGATAISRMLHFP